MDLRHATKQQVFDHVVHSLLEQGQPARTAHGFCKYHTAEGLSCAVGTLIDDDQYKPTMEGQGVVDLAARFPSLGIRPDHVTLLCDLQGAHDDWSMFPHDIQRFRDLLLQVARRHFLSQMAVFHTMPQATKEHHLANAH